MSTVKFVEVYCVTRNTNCEVWILPRIVHCINEQISVEHVNVDVLSALSKVTIKD